MNKKVLMSIKNRNKLINEKIERNNNKIEELKKINIELQEEKEKNEKDVLSEVLNILEIQPFEFMERFLSGEDKNSILKNEQKNEEINEIVDNNSDMEETTNE